MVSRFGRYELIRPLGKGGMAEVYLARQRGPGGFEKKLVIKRILPALAQDPRFLKLFFEEARLHASLSHGNLVSIFDFGRVGNEYFLAMDLVEGCDLARLLGSLPEKRLPPALLAYVGAELCHALQHVHRHGLVHGDLTPRNVLVSLDGQVKLTDFGVAHGTATGGGVRGTVAYMAPEQARGEAADARADLFSLGLVVAEAATGRRSRSFSSTDESLSVVSTAGSVEIDGPFAALVARATQHAPAERFADANEMASEFERIAGELGTARAGNARELSIRVRALPVEVGSSSAPSVDVRFSEHATYFRDAPTAVSFVDDLLAHAPIAAALPSSTRRARWIVPLLGIASIVTFVWLRPRSHPTTALQPEPQKSIITATAPSVAAAPPMITARVAPAARPTEAVAQVEVVCSPWCLVDVDGQRRGVDGRQHRLRLSPGRHKIEAERLEDKKAQIVELVSGRPSSLRFDFD